MLFEAFQPQAPNEAEQSTNPSWKCSSTARKPVILREAHRRTLVYGRPMARSRRTPAMLISKCCSKLSNPKLRTKPNNPRTRPGNVLRPPANPSSCAKRTAELSYTEGLWRAVEGPRRCSLANAVRSFPTTSSERSRTIHEPVLEMFFDLPQTRHPARSAPQNSRIRKAYGAQSKDPGDAH